MPDNPDSVTFPTVYRGNTGCSAHKRIREHLDAVRRGTDSSGIANHILQQHPEADTTQPELLISARVMDRRDKNMERGILESIRIEEGEQDPKISVCNRRSEWARTALTRVQIE